MIRTFIEYFFYQRWENKQKNFEIKKFQFEERIKQLQQNDDPKDIEEKRQIETSRDFRNEINQDLGWSCTKHEGVVTSLDSEGGMINNKHSFTKIKAKNVWLELKVGSKLKYLLFDNEVVSMEYIDPCWDDDVNDNSIIPVNTFKEGYNTELRTIIGTIEEISDGIITITTGRNKEYVPIDENSEWKYVEGDNLRLDCVTAEDETTWNPAIGSFGKIVSVSKITPNSIKFEIGNVTALFETYVIFDESVIYIKDNDEVKLFDVYEYEAIETSVSLDGRNFNWRVTKLVKKIESKDNRCVESYMKIQMNDENFDLRQSSRPITKFIAIFNNSDQKLTTTKCEITSNSGFIKLQNANKRFDLRAINGLYKVYFDITPMECGSFVEELSVDFGNFKKKCLIILHITNTRSTGNNRFNRHGQNSRSEIIPGQKIFTTPRFIEIRIPDFTIPDQFRNRFDFKKQMQLVIEDLSQHHHFLIEELNEQNYMAKMRYCLYLEEIAMEIFFERYRIDRQHFENKDEYLRLEVEGVCEKRPSIAFGDSILASDPFQLKGNTVPYQGIIHKIEQDAVLVKFTSEFHKTHNRKDFRIDFFFSRSSFRRQQFALQEVLSPNGLGLNFLFPKNININRNLQLDVTLSENNKILMNGNEEEFFNQSLNIYQRTAVINILRGAMRPLPYIIYGPPGTGKTRTVIECIEQIYSKIKWSRVIVCCPSNSAANLIVDKLIESGRYKGGDFIRFVSYNQIEKDAIPEHIKKYCATIDIGHDVGNAANFMTSESGMMMNASKSIITKYKIYISTLSNMALLMHIKFMSDHFTHVIIDEAGQAIEPETLIPIKFLSRNRGQVILAGDPKQLNPVVISQIAKFCRFEKSFLERLSEHKFYLPLYGVNRNEYDERFVTKLKKNYRALPSILNIYSTLYYNSDLEAEINDKNSREIKILNSLDSILWNRSTANKQCGVYFYNVNGRNLKIVDSSSWYNNEEASRLFFFVCKLKRLGIDMKDVGIITPYSLQVKNLRRIINESMPDCDLKVGSVEEFQGQERDVILVSTVRTNRNLIESDHQFGLGFIQCSKRMNVAVSRARALLVVFGKESLLAQDENWRYLIQYTKQNGTFVSEST